MKYRVIRNCYFGRRYYAQGEVVELADGIQAPPHMEALEKPKAVKPENEQTQPEAKPKRAVKRKAGTAGR